MFFYFIRNSLSGHLPFFPLYLPLLLLLPPPLPILPSISLLSNKRCIRMYTSSKWAWSPLLKSNDPQFLPNARWEC